MSNDNTFAGKKNDGNAEKVLPGVKYPHNLSVERSVLSAMLKEPACIDIAIEHLGTRSEVFFSQIHRIIFNAILDMHKQKNENIDVFTSAADAICMDGYVVNKVGTFQIAIAAKYNKIPYFVTGAPDHVHPTIDTVKIEMRDPEFSLQALGTKTTAEGVKGYYPAFDITPPELVSGVVTDTGIYAPYDLKRYFENGNLGEYEMVI